MRTAQILLAAALAACTQRTDSSPSTSRSTPAPAGSDASALPVVDRLDADGGIDFVTDPFDRFYELFLRHTINDSQKASLWQKYAGRWVRWTGKLISFSQSGITIQMRESTVTFDISLRMSAADRAAAEKRLHPGQRVTFIGRFQSYDDIFRTLYISNGAVANP